MHHYPTARSPSFVVGRVAAPAHFSVTAQRQDGTSLVEVGPRLVLAPIRVFAGSFGGATLYHDAGLVLPERGAPARAPRSQKRRLEVRAPQGGPGRAPRARRREHPLPEDELADRSGHRRNGLGWAFEWISSLPLALSCGSREACRTRSDVRRSAVRQSRGFSHKNCAAALLFTRFHAASERKF